MRIIVTAKNYYYEISDVRQHEIGRVFFAQVVDPIVAVIEVSIDKLMYSAYNKYLYYKGKTKIYSRYYMIKYVEIKKKRSSKIVRLR